MIVNFSFTSESTGKYYQSGFYISESEYETLSESDRNYVDSPITPDECPACEGKGTRIYESDYGNVYTKKCHTCNGTGKIEPDEEERDEFMERYKLGDSDMINDNKPTDI